MSHETHHCERCGDDRPLRKVIVHAARLVALFGAAERDLSLYERRQQG